MDSTGIPILDAPPTEAEQARADLFFSQMASSRVPVDGMARIIKHLGGLLVLYAQQEDEIMKEQERRLREVNDREADGRVI